MEGIIVVDKPSGMTSHDVVAIARRKLRERRIGHAGTLDPLATGVLVLLVGRATRLFERFVAFDKEYQAAMKLGVRTESADIQGKIVEEGSPTDIFTNPTQERTRTFLKAVLAD